MSDVNPGRMVDLESFIDRADLSVLLSEVRFAAFSPLSWKQMAERLRRERARITGGAIQLLRSEPSLLPALERAQALIEAQAECIDEVRFLDLSCQFDGLNPCWDDRPGDVIGKHWGGGESCHSCSALGRLAWVDQMEVSPWLT